MFFNSSIKHTQINKGNTNILSSYYFIYTTFTYFYFHLPRKIRQMGIGAKIRRFPISQKTSHFVSQPPQELSERGF